MTRNSEDHFGELPTKQIKRSKFYMPSHHLTSLNTGDIVPIYLKEILPGDTLEMDESMVVRMTTPIAPVMDNAWIDTYYFYCPNRLVYDHWQELMGENKTDAWTQTTEYVLPKLKAPQGGWQKGSIAEKFGVPIGVEVDINNALPFRAYTLIYNEWFRNQNVSEPAEITMDDTDTNGSNGTDYVTDLQKGGMCAKAVKFSDVFTRSLPQPQKGDPVYLPLGTAAPVYTGEPHENYIKDNEPLHWIWSTGTTAEGGNYPLYKDQDAYTGVSTDAQVSTGQRYITPDNLYADLTNATAATINQLRQAFAVQRMAEIDATAGTRYIEIIRAHFSVDSPDARLQRPEYLGGKRCPINMRDIEQTSSTDATSPQGNVSGMSKTIDSHNLFTKSFTEHGMVIGLAVIRTEHTYQQGLPKFLTKSSKLDFYWPSLSNIGNVGIKNREIYAQGTEDDNGVFGYQEAWYEYRYGVNRVSGELSSNYSTPLDIWHYADDYSQLPTLSHAWVSETDANVQRTLAVQSQDQFIADFYFDEKMVRPMPTYSVPGLTSWM